MAIILPLRYVPFDIGAKITEDCKLHILHTMEKQYKRILPTGFMQSIGCDVQLIFQITQELKLYIFPYGIGVFSIIDQAFPIDDDKFSIEYCEERKIRHHEILEFETEYSETMEKVIRNIREIVKYHSNSVRKSSSVEWENKGLSYVMTVGMIQTNQRKTSWAELPNSLKYNILVMLRPSIVNLEDSLFVSYKADLDQDFFSAPIDTFEDPEDYSMYHDYSLFVSWASVISVQEKITNTLINLIETIEVDLQSMWMYIYCLNYELKTVDRHSKLYFFEERLYHIQRLFLRFKRVDDSSAPDYITQTRHAIMTSSGIFEQYEETGCCIIIIVLLIFSLFVK